MANRFRKVFIVCENNQVFNKITQVPMYRTRYDAEYACNFLIKRAAEESIKLSNANVPLPKFKVHGFYLVHEDMFRE